MKTFHRLFVTLSAVTMLSGIVTAPVARALSPAPSSPSTALSASPPVEDFSLTQAPSAVAGNFCGGEPPIQVGLGLNLNAECKTLYGPTASATYIRPDAYGWVCRVPKQRDKGLDMQLACRRSYGSTAIATLVGIGTYDWRCLRPADVSGKVVPVLLLPVEKLNLAEVPFVTTALQRLATLTGGIRSFYQEKTSALVRGTNAFVLLTSTSANDWQNLALATDHASGGFPLDRYGYHKRIKQELANGRWNVLAANSSVKIGGFATLGSAPPQAPTTLGAAGDGNGSYFSAAPSNSYAGCSPALPNSSLYENAFYGAGHEFGHTMGLPHTDNPDDPGNPNDYTYHHEDPNSNLLRPDNWEHSIMYRGQGTASELFPHEAARLLDFLLDWY